MGKVVFLQCSDLQFIVLLNRLQQQGKYLIPLPVKRLLEVTLLLLPDWWSLLKNEWIATGNFKAE
jgi:hypothetical protein